MLDKTLVAAAAALLLVACNYPDQIVSPRAPAGAPARLTTTSEPPQEPVATAYLRTFVRQAGAPDTYVETLDLSGFEGEFTLIVTNGDDSGKSRIHAGGLWVDAVELLRDADLARPNTSFEFSFADAPRTLELRLASKPAGFVRIEIRGHPRRWRVCPGESAYRTYSTVQEAVAAADPGATIWLCDGIHDAAAVVTKPLTILPEHAGAVTLRDTLAWSSTQGGLAPVFWVDGFAAGTFRVADINFVLRQSAVVATGTWSRIELDNVRITSVDSAHTIAIRSFASTVPDAQLTVTRSSASGVAGSVLANGGFVTVSQSDFQRNDRAISFRWASSSLTAAQGRIENNTFGPCNIGGCLLIGGRGGVHASGNTFTKAADSPPGPAIQIRTLFVPDDSQQLPITIENNTVTGVRGALGPDVRTWPFPTAVQILATNPDVAPLSIEIVGNRFTNVGTGITVNSANGTVVNAHDNVITGAREGIRHNKNDPAHVGTSINSSTIVFRRNDVVGSDRYFGVYLTDQSLDLTCNWWGSTAGPINPDWQGDSSVYTPWAMEPIAGREDVSCP